MTVNVWLAPVALVAFCGAIVMFASTHCFVAGPLPPGPELMLAVAGSVSRVSADAVTVRLADALAIVLPAVGLLMISVHWPFAFVVPLRAVRRRTCRP